MKGSQSAENLSCCIRAVQGFALDSGVDLNPCQGFVSRRN